VGALSVALAPLLGFVSGAVNPESMLIAISATSFFLLARGFRRGFTRNLAITTSLAMIVGLLITDGRVATVDFSGRSCLAES
jgi:4-amino-4-deoxy-L-arabinose transferase-like glycosyltransferase